MRTFHITLACLVLLSFASLSLANIIIEKEASAPVEAADFSATKTLNRLAQRIRATKTTSAATAVSERSLLSSKASAKAVLQAFTDTLPGANPWASAYEQCDSTTLTAIQDLFNTYWSGSSGSQGFANLFESMGDDATKGVLRLRQLRDVLKTAIVPSTGGVATPNSDLRAYGDALEELLFPFSNLESALGLVNADDTTWFTKSVLASSHLTHPAFTYTSALASYAAADAVILSKFPHGEGEVHAHPEMEAARSRTLGQVSELNAAVAQALLDGSASAAAGPIHFCTTLSGIATIVTAALHELRALSATTGYDCTYEASFDLSGNANEVTWVPVTPSQDFLFYDSSAGLEIRSNNSLFNSFGSSTYRNLLSEDGELNAKMLDEQNVDFAAALQDYVSANNLSADHFAVQVGKFRSQLTLRGSGRALVVAAAARRLGHVDNPSHAEVVDAVKAALIAKADHCIA